MTSSVLSLLLLACCASTAAGKNATYSSEGYTVRFRDLVGNFNQAIQDRMVNTFFIVYPQLVAEYNANAPKTVTFIIDPAYNGVAGTSVDVIRYSSSYLTQFPQDIDVVTHELMHVVQAYKTSVPGWAVEGIADYVRYIFGVDNAGAGWSLPPFEVSQKYTDSYGVTARFFLWIERMVKAGFVKGYDAALRAGTHALFFQSFTGKTVDQLWAQYAQNPAIFGENEF